MLETPKSRSRSTTSVSKSSRHLQQGAPPIKHEEPKTGGGDGTIEGDEAVDLPENVEAEPEQRASADDPGNAMKGVPLPIPAEERRKDATGTTPGHRGRSSKKTSANDEPRRESS